MRSRVVVGVNAGGVVLALGLALLVPLALSLLYRDGSWASFLVPAALMIPLGAASLRASRLREVSFVLERDVYFAVTLAWTLAAVLGGVPYLLEGTFASPLDSTFEGMSGFTTTGATLLADIEAETPSILFWRSMTQWLGGIGIVVLFVAVAPALGAGAARLLGAEVSGLRRWAELGTREVVHEDGTRERRPVVVRSSRVYRNHFLTGRGLRASAFFVRRKVAEGPYG